MSLTSSRVITTLPPRLVSCAKSDLSIHEWDSRHQASGDQELFLELAPCALAMAKKLQHPHFPRRTPAKMMTCALSIAVLISSAFLAQVDAHGYVSSPPARFINEANYTHWDLIVEAKDVGEPFVGKKWDDNPIQNTNMFTTTFANQTRFSTLRDFSDHFVADCANTRLDVPAVDVSNLTTVKYQNDEKQMGGPCEIWIGDTKAFQTNDCRGYTTDYPAVFPVDYSVCKGDCILTFYLVAVHEPRWQIYKQCVPIVNEFGIGPLSSGGQASIHGSSSSSGAESGKPGATGSADDARGSQSAPRVPKSATASSNRPSKFILAWGVALLSVAAQW
ncbi:hypothetical protein FI667_g4084, partial [Globisporangium splendens]